jgi:hypothetical protein
MWDPAYVGSVSPYEKWLAERAFSRYLEDPDYFLALYADPVAWYASEEVRGLEWFAQYSLYRHTHQTAEGLVLAGQSSLVVENLHQAHLLHMVGEDVQAGALAAVAMAGATNPLRGKAATEAARELGYTRRIPPQKAHFNSHGQPVFYNSKTSTYITPDIDMHRGGVWKMFDRRGRRIGTYDAQLNRIGP